jgi:hypothetical protein
VDDGSVRIYGYVFLVRNGSRSLELINDVIGHVVERGSFMHIKERCLVEQKIEPTFNSPTFAYMYATISTSHLQTALCLLLLGYVLALACFVTELLRQHYRSKG